MVGPLLIASIGLPGSGKTTFLRRFAGERHYFYWRSDDARRHMIKEPKHTFEEHDLMGRTASYVFNQLLGLDITCVFDSNLNKRRHRAKFASMAESHGGQFWVFWFQVPVDLAKERAANRAATATGAEKAYFATFRPDLVEHIAEELEPPGAGDRFIIIDGTASYQEQLAQVQKFLLS
jgi:predicted kinase